MPGPNGCGGAGQGSYGHYQQDVNTFAAWGFDAVKVDFCGGAEYHLNPASAYSQFHAAILANASHRPMLLSICDFLQPEQYGEGRPILGESAFASYSFGPSVGNSWRTDTDVGLPGNVPFTDVLRNIDADAAAPQAAGPGHWNDPDYLGPGTGDVRRPVPLAVQHVGDARRAADGQRRPHQDQLREPRRRSRTPK